MIIAGFESIDELKYLIKINIPGIFIGSWIADNPKVYEVIKDSNYNGIIATDGEGGYASWIVKNIPPPKELSNLNPYDFYSIVQTIALKLKEHFINLNFAPVVDLHDELNPVIGKKKRAFSDDPYKIVFYASLFIKAHSEIGIKNCIKHFVGQGRAIGDPHYKKSILIGGLKELKKDLLPFMYFIKFGIEYIMTAHVYVPAIDKEKPVTLSRFFIVELLRNLLGYKGKIITDDLNMSAISEVFGVLEAIKIIKKLPIDYVLISRGIETIEKAYKILKG
ncbi:MAG: glycoside hydrolase family 3 N-terminal domain-containing protein [candidate division WOR-3 bacterium]|jgi:beta-N-acetylhexosaminidase